MRLKKWLKEAECSQEAFAALLGDALGRPIRQSTVSKLVALVYDPGADVKAAIKKLTGGRVAEADWGKRARP